jgi:hypothetical protein
MSGTRNYLQVEVTVTSSTVIALAVLAAITSYIISSVVIGTAYIIFVSAALSSLLLSLCIGGYGMIKSLLLLDCDQWNIRMVSCGFVIQVVLICIGLLCFLMSLLFIH